MAAVETTEVAVIGAGVIGLAVAQRLASEGREVVMLDPAAPGSGASWGNAGTIADHSVQPVGTPDVLRSLPRLLFDRNSPLAIRRAALPALAPWLLRFVRQCRPEAARANGFALAGLLADAGPRWRDLAATAGATALLKDTGCLYLYETAAALRAAESDIAFRRDLGVRVEMLSAAELAAFEPGLGGQAGGGAFFPGALFITDPGAMMARLARAAEAAGVEHRAASITGLRREAAGVSLSGPGAALRARHVVIAAGAHSRALARQAGARIPLETERGYHVEYDMAVPRLTRPVCPTARGFYLCPMSGRLRAAGTVELGGLSAPPSPHRIARLDAGARAILADLPPPDRSWMGFRPSLPDSLPAIGPAAAGTDVILAFGHGHLGLTLAPVTAAICADLIAGRAPAVAIDRVDPGRFSARRG